MPQVEIEGQFKIFLDAYLKKLHDANEGSTFEVHAGKRWVKLQQFHQGTDFGVFCFIDPSDGVIYKPETWHKPAKDGRGNIYGYTPVIGADLYKELDVRKRHGLGQFDGKVIHKNYKQFNNGEL